MIRKLLVLLLVTCTFLSTCLAQDEDASMTLPNCALSCLAELIPKSSCDPKDQACICANTELSVEVGACVQGACLIREVLQTTNISLTTCGAQVRDETHLPGLIGMVGGAIALVAFLLRMVAYSPLMGRTYGWEDYAIALAFALTIPPTVFAVYLGDNGLGKDIWTLPIENIERVLFLYYLGELFYAAAGAMIKISILFFLLRVFPMFRGFRIACWVIMGLSFAYGLTFFIVTLFQCWPINHFWLQLEDEHHGYCHDANALGWASAITNMTLDLVILVLPLRQLYKLQITLKKKMLTMGMFCLGVFVTIVSIVRLQSLIYFAHSSNITWDYMAAAYWSTIELHAGIVTACLPAVRALMVGMGVRAFGTTAQKSSGGSRSMGNTVDSKLSRSDNSKQQPPRAGDENEFIPLVDVESGKHGQNWPLASAPANGNIMQKTEIMQEVRPIDHRGSYEHEKAMEHNRF